MKKKGIIVALLCFTATVFAAPGLNITGTYLTPINPPEDLTSGSTYIDKNFGFGLEYGFWGIFSVGGNVYTDITWNAENFMGVEEITPIGLFSAGFGMDIPMGPIHFIMDWQKFYNAGKEEGDIFDYSDSFKYGIRVKVNQHIGLEAYSRKLYNFSAQAKTNTALTKEEIDFIGLGLIINLNSFAKSHNNSPDEEEDADEGWLEELEDVWDNEIKAEIKKEIKEEIREEIEEEIRVEIKAEMEKEMAESASEETVSQKESSETDFESRAKELVESEGEF